MPDQPQPHRFDINAAVVFRLGEELITDVVQALVELVKNSYDADATWVQVTINTREHNKWGLRFADAIGAILVEDNGHGMDDHTIRNGWLTIASSPKRQQKAAGRATRRGRTPIGDKGLGRLGSQKLARNVEILTRSRDHPTTEHYVAFSWADFLGSRSLRAVPVKFDSREVAGTHHGTKLVLSGLRDPDKWRTREHVLDLQRKLSAMLSPFEEPNDFRVHLEIDGERLELAEIARRVRESALLKYAFDFDGQVMHISGSAKLSFFQPRAKDDERLFRSLCVADDGATLYDYLACRKGKGRPDLFALSECAEWFVQFGTSRSLDDLPRVRRVKQSTVSPGPFRGEVDSLSLDRSDIKDDVLSRQSEYRRLVRDLAGIRVYRDGFGIRVGEDWLGLGKQQTQATSYYGLRPGNVLGFVALSARDNPHLVETTSREGFQVTPHYENFFSLLTTFVKFAGDAQAYLRRGFISFLNEHRDRQAGVAPEEPHSAVTRRIDDIAGRLSSERAKLNRRTGALRMAATGAAEKLDAVRTELSESLVKGSSGSGALESLAAELSTVSTEVAKDERLISQISSALKEATELRAMRDVLDRRWQVLNDQMAAMYESISLGLTAEALSHEIHNIADRLAKRSASLTVELQGRTRSPSLVTFLEEVRSSVAAMRKQLAHLTPSLRYLRERRDQIDLGSFIQEFADFYQERLAANGIQPLLNVPSKEFSVYMNKGKLTQVFDNLVLNAEYWLKDALSAGFIDKGTIGISVAAPYVRVADNGRGVETTVEDSLFEPFVTMKRNGDGRGLGLYVCRQLLESESCDLVLLPDRNKAGRRYVFEVDLSGAARE